MAGNNKSEIKTRVYCESCFFIALINLEDGRYQICKQIVDDAKSNQIEIVTSHATRIECGKPNRGAIESGATDIIGAFFDLDYIETVNVDWHVANHARQISAENNVAAYDALHLATANLESVEYFFTYDNALIKLNGTRLFPDMKICKPIRPWALQLDLRDAISSAENLDMPISSIGIDRRPVNPSGIEYQKGN